MLEKVGRYELKKLLGEGTDGAIFEGLDPLMARQVAVKVYWRSRFSATRAASLNARFQREARVAGILHHPNIVPVYDAGTDGDLLYLVLQYAQGEDLGSILARQGRLAPEQALDLAVDVLEALEHAHGHGVCHRKLAPDNLLLDGARCRLTDFGAAHIASDGPDLGSRIPNRYSAPELILSEPLDARSDLFSAGAIFYEWFTGIHPFQAANDFLCFQRITTSEPAPVSSHQPSLPSSLDHVLRRALARVPTERYPNARAFREELERIRDSVRSELRTQGATSPQVERAQTGPITAISSADADGWPGQEDVTSEHLPPGTVLQEFKLGRTLATGGFGIVYLADDTSLGRRVAIKEYFPQSMARRSTGGRVEAVAPNQALFASALDSFYREAQMLASFDHPALVRVHRTFRENGTAYIAMPYYDGETVKSYVQRGEPLVTEAWLRDLLLRVGDALQVLHARGISHRDVAPDNIMLVNGRPILLDFGAARQVVAGADRTLTVILKQGYAPIEQYAERGRQGPWTDIYALAAVAYYCLAGRPPPPSVDRALEAGTALMRGFAGRGFSGDLLDAIEAGLELDPARRPQTIEQFLAPIRL